MQDAKIIKSNLQKYPFIKRFLGSIIEQRLQIECYTHGMLTANLLVHKGLTICDLQRLDYALQLGNLYCKDFNRIFGGKRLPQQSEIADGQIIDILAEVKAFEFLHIQGFSDISKVKHQANIRTVDFNAKRNSQNYAVEVTRLGLASSDKKKPKLDKLSRPPYLTIVSSKEPQNRDRIAEDIHDKIIGKYPQIKEFCQREREVWKGILIISNGRDYFVAGRYENKLYELQPHTIARVLKQEWNLLKGEMEDYYKYLHHIIITMGKDIREAIMYPNLVEEQKT